MGKLFIVATPIGNLKDITLRALETLKEVDAVLSEDTRVAAKLLNAFDIKKEVYSYHQHSAEPQKLKILDLLQKDKNLALVTDAGTPGISDPGNELINFLVEALPELEVTPVPGPSAVTALLSVSGVNTQHFTFLGFFPKTHHSRFVKELKKYSHPVVFFESPYRILKTLKELSENLPAETQAVVGRELTKTYETLYRGTISEVIKKLELGKQVKGEFVVMIQST